MHRLLERQVKRALGLDALQWTRLPEAFQKLADGLADQDGELARALSGVPTLLGRVSDAYAQQDRDLALIRRSLELSSAELSEASQKLRGEAQASSLALAALQGAFDTLQADGGAQGGDLVSMAGQIAGLTRDREQIRAALAKSEERFDLAMRGANDGVWDWDMTRQCVYYSPRWKAMLGYGVDEIGTDLNEWSGRLHPDDLAMARAAIDAHLCGETDHFETVFRFRHKDGHYLWVLSRGQAVFDANDTPLRMVGTHTDVSEQKRVEAELIQALASAEAASRSKSEFLANMSHEIRTPMNGVLGMLTLALDTQLNMEHREYLDLARSSADALLHILNDILDFSKIEAGRLDVEAEAFELDAMLRELLRLEAPRCREKGLTLTLSLDPGLPTTLLADPARVRQVLLNLLGNAIKFTQHGTITLVARREGEQARIAVRDTGIGIPLDKQPAVFEAFTQADGSITRRFGGTGLGLTISNRLVHLMGGKMGLDSEPGVGSEFYFFLPLATDPVATREVAVLATRGEPLDILLAEDNPINQRLAIRLLEREGHRVTLAENGQETLDALEKASYDLVLMDMQMPGLDGLEATRRIRKREARWAHLPIIALTANAYAEDRERCLLAGMDGFVSKPIRREELLATIQTVMALRSPAHGQPVHP